MEITNDQQSQSLAKEFLDDEYRRAWAEDYLNTTLAQQIAILRRARNWKQSDLAAMANTTQSAVSRMEDVEYGAHSIRVLKQLAAAFGLRLKVSFEEFGSLLEESAAFTEESLGRRSFHVDPMIAKLLAVQGLNPPAPPAAPASSDLPDAVTPAPLSQRAVPFQQQFEAVLNGPLASRIRPLKKWLMGYGVPTPEAPAYKTLYFALPTDYRHGEWAIHLAEACAELLLPETFAELLSDPDDGPTALVNLLRLSAMLAAGQEHISGACAVLFPWLRDEWTTLPPVVRQAVIDLAVELADGKLTEKLLSWPETAGLCSDTLALFNAFLGPEMNESVRQALASSFDVGSRKSGKGNDPSILEISERVIKELRPTELARQELQKSPNERVAIAQTLLCAIK